MGITLDVLREHVVDDGVLAHPQLQAARKAGLVTGLCCVRNLCRRW